jgi:formate-nitrite transporter family protein
MGVEPDPKTIYERAEAEGRRRLGMPTLEQATTGFIAGVTIVFGIVALGVVTKDVAASFSPGIANVAGALAFGIGIVFLVVGRAELFSEDFFDPVAVAIDERGTAVWGRLLRLWVVTLALNLVGGAVMIAIVTIDGALPSGTAETLIAVAQETAGKPWSATLARAVLAGALITLLSYMLNATNTVAARILIAFLVGFFLALGPFDHVVVSALHLLAGIWLGGDIGYTDLARNLGLATVGNLIGGLLLITFTHSAQVKSSNS